MAKTPSLFNALFNALVVLAMIRHHSPTGYETIKGSASEIILSPNEYADKPFPTIMNQLHHRVTFLAYLIPSFGEALKYAIAEGAFPVRGVDFNCQHSKLDREINFKTLFFIRKLQPGIDV